jgi:hypothetical protein
MQFLYKGFIQKANIRSFRFQGVAADRASRHPQHFDFLLSADMALLARHRIQVQDGPTLCLRILAAGLSAEGADTVQFSSYAITQGDVSAFASARDALTESKAARRRHRPPFKPSATSQFQWPRTK